MSGAYLPIPGQSAWEARQRAALAADELRFQTMVRVKQANLEAVKCESCRKVLGMHSRGATTTLLGITRCAPCRRRVTR